MFILDAVYADLPSPAFTAEEKRMVAANVYAHVWRQAVGGWVCTGGLRSRRVTSATVLRSPAMPDTAEDLARRAKQLPPDERERLVDALLESLNVPATAELDAAWAAEIERRLAAYDRGEVKAIPVDEVFAKARAIAQ